MDEKTAEHFREKLLALKQALEDIESTSGDATKTVELDQQSVGRLSRMDALQAQQMAKASEERRKQELVRIEGALRRLDSGDFGFCFVCGDEIDPRRLEIDPTITRCLACAESSEG